MSVEKVTQQDHQNVTAHNVLNIEEVIPQTIVAPVTVLQTSNEENGSKGTIDDSSLYLSGQEEEENNTITTQENATATVIPNPQTNKICLQLEIAYEEDRNAGGSISGFASDTSLLFHSTKYTVFTLPEDEVDGPSMIESLNQLISVNRDNTFVTWDYVAELPFMSQILEQVRTEEDVQSRVTFFLQLMVARYFKQMHLAIVRPEETVDSNHGTVPIMTYPYRKHRKGLDVLGNFYTIAQNGINEYVKDQLKGSSQISFLGNDFVTFNARVVNDGDSYYHGNAWGCYAVKVPKTLDSDQYYYATLYGYIVKNDCESKHYTYTLRHIETSAVWDLQNGRCLCVIEFPPLIILILMHSLTQQYFILFI